MSDKTKLLDHYIRARERFIEESTVLRSRLEVTESEILKLNALIANYEYKTEEIKLESKELL